MEEESASDAPEPARPHHHAPERAGSQRRRRRSRLDSTQGLDPEPPGDLPSGLIPSPNAIRKRLAPTSGPEVFRHSRRWSLAGRSYKSRRFQIRLLHWGAGPATPCPGGRNTLAYAQNPGCVPGRDPGFGDPSSRQGLVDLGICVQKGPNSRRAHSGGPFWSLDI